MKTILYYSMSRDEAAFLESRMSGADGYHLIACPDEAAFRMASSYAGVDLVIDGSAQARLDEAYFAMLEQAGIRYMVLRMTGVGQVDFTSATAHHVRIANVQNYSPNAIAELTVALAMGFNRRLFEIAERSSQADFRVDYPQFREIRDCTVGVLGVGHIGGTTARIFAGMGARVLGFDAHQNEEYKPFVTYAGMDEIRREADIICVHLPALAENYHLIGDDFLKGVRRDVIIVNAARGELTDLSAVIRAVREDRIGGYGADVVENEQQIFHRTGKDIHDETMLAAIALYPKIVFVPHLGAYTERARKAMITITEQEAESLLKDGTALYLLNPGA